MKFYLFITLLICGLQSEVQAQLASLTIDRPKWEKRYDYQLKRLDKRINSPFHEGAPLISTDGSVLYFFVADHPDNKYGTKGSQDIWYTERTSNGNWLDAVHMPSPLNQNRYNQVMSIINDGNTLLIRGKEKASKGFSITHRNFNGWNNPTPIRIKDYDKMCKGVYSGGILSQHGDVLLLYFNELKEQTISDLYVSFKQNDGSWSKPDFIEALNTSHDEFGPTLDPDGSTLYFASTRPGGQGSSDIYLTKRLDDTWLKWSDPINLGAPVNTSGFDAYYSVDDKGNVFTTRAYMSPDGGSLDILSLIPVEKPKPKLAIWGYVYDRETEESVSAATVKYEIHQIVADEVASDNIDGFYEVIITGDGTYQILTTADGYMNASDELVVPVVESDTIIQKDLFVDRIEIGTTVRLNNIFFDFDKTTLRPESITELNTLVEFLKSNPSVKAQISGHTDTKGSDQYNINLSEGRAGSVRAYLLENWIDHDRITSQGYGEGVPVATNETDEGRQLNRRVEFTILEI